MANRKKRAAQTLAEMQREIRKSIESTRRDMQSLKKLVKEITKGTKRLLRAAERHASS